MLLSRDHARLALATIRLVNGTLALVAPNTLLRRLGADPNANKVAIYPMRMFGIRTVVLGVQLLIDAPSPEADRFGVLIHATRRCDGDHGRAPPGIATAGRRHDHRDFADQYGTRRRHRLAGKGGLQLIL